MMDKKALDHLNLCLKTAHMGFWEAVLSRNSLSASDVYWDEETRAMHAVPPDYQGDLAAWFFEHLHPEDLSTLPERLAPLFDRQNPRSILTIHYRYCWPNGEVHYIEKHISVEKELEHGVKLYGVSKDVTQDVLKQKLIEDQKNRLLSASRMAVLGEISGGIAHEINNPLTVIQARSFQLQQMCESGNLDAAKIKSAAESISKTGDKIAKIIKSLRAFSHNQEEQPVDKISVRELIQETLDFCKVRFFNHGIDVRVGEIPEQLEFECRLAQIEEALLSLFNNSHDAIVNSDDKWILIEAFDKGAQVEIHVTDSGHGIPEGVVDKMMLPFFSTKEIGKGMGLGLCISSEIIHQHHGVLIYDRTSPNTKFVVRIPKTQPS